jgi:hypothetical protein
MLDKQKMERAVTAMTQSPLFHLSLSSKELFHSNFLYWLSLQNAQELARALCPDFDSGGELVIVREKRVASGQNKAVLDLCVSNSRGESLVVENKVKDYPEAQQLSRIANSLPGSNNTLVLLSLLPIEEGAFKLWRRLDYKTLSSRLDPAKFSTDRYHQDLVIDYRDFIRHLSDFADTLGFGLDYDFAIAHDVALFRTLNSHRLWEAYQKMRASHMIAFYNTRYRLDGVRTLYSINHQKATMDFLLDVVPGKWLGISIENNQYRRYLHSGSAQKDATAMLDNGIFFKRDFESQRRHDSFLNYGDVTRYQYERMNDPVPFDILFRTVNKDLQDGVIANLVRIRELMG